MNPLTAEEIPMGLEYDPLHSNMDGILNNQYQS